MDKLIIEGGKLLDGAITVSGAKNSSLPILAATLLTDSQCIVHGVPGVMDIRTMLKIIGALGIASQFERGSIVTNPASQDTCVAPYELVSTMRASICVLGPLLAKRGFAKVSLPGGCVIGPRPINLHLKGLAMMGAEIEIEGGYVIARAKQLKGRHVYLGGPFGSSVLATANIMMAATMAKGTTVIENAACEPEVVDLANFLNKMGAKIRGIKTHVIEVEGVKALAGAEHTIIPDRIETGTYLIAGILAAKDLTLKNIEVNHIRAILDILKEAGVSVKMHNGEISVRRVRRLRPSDVTTLPYPGFPTDMQAQMMALLCCADGISVITERVYPERFMHVSELNRMGAQIKLEGSSAIIRGKKKLSGAPVMASDLRASAALVLGGLVADGATEISRIYHLDRGYERLDEKLSGVGARIRREKA
ncbi:MAG: UDP-N-acetylglucosamine 1-carboxyvinyltransferase [Candidatus Omnitrophica bacterium]|nr:UDP-N-acetylglucosamine 1-carboxyvinyltransferase [Candidatus Omnitrophota bacterium]